MSDNVQTEYNGFKFGFVKSPHDARDYKLYPTPINPKLIPNSANVEKLMPANNDITRLDQKDVGGCVGFSGCSTFYGVMKADAHPAPFIGSPPFAYRQARSLDPENDVNYDNGANLRDFWKSTAKFGLPKYESLPPAFGPGQSADSNSLFPPGSVWREQPSQTVFDEAQQTLAIKYFRLDTIQEMMQCVADGWPFQFGFPVFNSFFDPSGQPRITVPNPAKGDYIVGYHAVSGFRYSRSAGRFTFRNNWGRTAHGGKSPNFSLTFGFVDKYKMDALTCRIVSGGKQ